MSQFNSYHTKRLNMRPYNHEDFNHFFLLLTHPLVNFSLGTPCFLSRPYLVKKFLEQIMQKSAIVQQWLLYSIFYKDNNQLIGGCGFKINREYTNAEIFYFIFPEYWGRGLMVEACCPLLNDSFSRVGLQYVYALIRPGNIRAQRVVEKLNFRNSKIISLDRYGHSGKVQKWTMGCNVKIHEHF